MKEFRKTLKNYQNTLVVQCHLGDVIFSMELIKRIVDFSKPVIWGIENHFVEGLQRAYPEIQWVDMDLINLGHRKHLFDEVLGTTRIVPIEHSKYLSQREYRYVMRSKYDIYGLNWEDWRKSKFVRTPEREQELFKVLGIAQGERYNLINMSFRSDFSGQVDVKVHNDYKNVNLSLLEGFSLFDWCGVIENAQEIHTVGTSINFIIEQLSLKNDTVYVYMRRPDETHYNNYNYILQRHKYVYR